MPRRSPLLIVPLLALVLAAPSAGAVRSDGSLKRSKDLWATVNVCDTPARPNVIGIRGSMPASGRLETLEMRFQVHYLDRAGDGKWHNLESGADSGYIRVGTARKRPLESGYSFTFTPPAGGSTLRGVITYRWRARGRTVRSFREITEAGHRSTRGADPVGFTAATCELR